MSSLQQNWRKGQNRFCLEARGVGGRKREWSAGRRNDPSNVCTHKYMNKDKKLTALFFILRFFFLIHLFICAYIDGKVIFCRRYESHVPYLLSPSYAPSFVN
jgi:hypothetical protein